jgi:hypothetical protein
MRREGRAPKRAESADITVKWARSRNHNVKEKAVETQPERRLAMRGNQISKLYPNTAKLIVSVTFMPGIVDFSFW